VRKKQIFTETIIANWRRQNDESDIGQIYRDNALYFGAKLHYNDKIYTSSWEQSSTDQNDLNSDTMLGDELGTVSGNHTVYHLIVFDCLNDVTMNTGKDLFEERLHLGEARIIPNT
jgi:hypothetical protein